MKHRLFSKKKKKKQMREKEKESETAVNFKVGKQILSVTFAHGLHGTREFARDSLVAIKTEALQAFNVLCFALAEIFALC